MSDQANPVRIGVIGAGRIGQVHAQALATRVAGARLVGVADVVLTAAEALGRRYGVPATADYRELLADDAIDAIAICSSTDTHAQIMIEAAAAGKQIFCEKPIDLDLARVDEALAAVDAAGVRLMVGFNRRFDPNFQRIKARIAAGEIGRPHLLRITSRDPAPPPLSYIAVSGGLFLDMTIHDFDMARFLFGEVEEVSAAAAVLVDPAIGEAGDVDTALITLRFANGALGAIDNSRQAVYGYDQRVEAFGSAGMAQVNNEYPNTHAYFSADGVTRDKPHHFFLERYMAAYVAEMQAFVAALRDGGPMPVSGADARAPVVLALAAQRSVRERRPVRVAEIE